MHISYQTRSAGQELLIITPQELFPRVLEFADKGEKRILAVSGSRDSRWVGVGEDMRPSEPGHSERKERICPCQWVIY